MLEDANPEAGESPLGTNPAAQPAVPPSIPTPHRLPEPVTIGSLLMKPARTGDESVDGLLGGPPFAARSEAIPEKIKPLSGSHAPASLPLS